MAEIMVSVPARLEHLDRLRREVLAVGSMAGAAIPPETLRHWGLAIYEAATNIVRHGYLGGSDETITLGIELGADRVKFRLIDSAPLTVSSSRPSLELSSEGGIGLGIIHHVMEQVIYRQTPQGNELCMTATW